MEKIKWEKEGYKLYAMNYGYIMSFTMGCSKSIEEEIEYKGTVDYDFWLVEKDGVIDFYTTKFDILAPGCEIEVTKVKTVKGKIVENGVVSFKDNEVSPFGVFGGDIVIAFKNYRIIREKPVKILMEEAEPESRLVEYGCSNREFKSTEDVRNFVLDNRDEYDGYIVRSYNGWDSDTIYRWQELANGKIIWRKEKA